MKRLATFKIEGLPGGVQYKPVWVNVDYGGSYDRALEEAYNRLEDVYPGCYIVLVALEAVR